MASVQDAAAFGMASIVVPDTAEHAGSGVGAVLARHYGPAADGSARFAFVVCIMRKSATYTPFAYVHESVGPIAGSRELASS